MSYLTPNKRLVSLPEFLPTNRTISIGKSCVTKHKQVKLEQDYCTTCSHLSEDLIGNLGTSAIIFLSQLSYPQSLTTVIYIYIFIKM